VERVGERTPVGFGPLLRAHRERSCWSQEHLAERAGVSVRTIGYLESGRVKRPHGVTRRLLADALELTPPERAELDAAVGRAVAGQPAVPAGSAAVAPAGVDDTEETTGLLVLVAEARVELDRYASAVVWAAESLSLALVERGRMTLHRVRLSDAE